MTALAGEGQEVLVAAVFEFHAGEIVVQIHNFSPLRKSDRHIVELSFYLLRRKFVHLFFPYWPRTRKFKRLNSYKIMR